MKKYSYWLDTVDQDFLKDANLPEKSDALVVGFGYTGLHAAFEMAKNGMKVCVIDKCNLRFTLFPESRLGIYCLRFFSSSCS
mgnify:CR=1 FL=1